MAEYAKPLPKTIFDDYKLRLTAPKPDGQRRAATLRVTVLRNNPRIEVYTEVEGAPNSGRITAPMDPQTFFALIDLIKERIEGPADESRAVINKVGAPTDKKIVSKTIVGKDVQGRMYIALQASGQTTVRFIFLPSDWHVLLHKDGTPYTEAELSIVYANAWCELFTQLVPMAMVAHYEEPLPRDQQSGGKTWGNKKPYNNPQSGTAKPAETYDDDFPM